MKFRIERDEVGGMVFLYVDNRLLTSMTITLWSFALANARLVPGPVLVSDSQHSDGYATAPDCA